MSPSSPALPQSRTLVELSRQRARAHGTRPAFVFLSGEAETGISYAELDARAQAIARGLLRRVSAGARVLLLCPPGLEYVTLFVGCMYAGVVAVPLYPPRLKQRTDRVTRVLSNCDAKLIVTTGSLLEPLADYLGRDAGAGSELTSVERLADEALDTALPEVTPEDFAFIQYTSGSTGAPKGVVVSHRNMMANLQALKETIECGELDMFVNWLPLFHDLGLIGTVLLPLFSGARSVLMNPAAFVQSPIAWLQAISRYRGTVCGGPNFAYELCIDRIQPAHLQGLDLSSWRVAFNAAEPVLAATLQSFSARFAAAGFSHQAFYPCYGMAEATVFLAGGKPRQAAVIRPFDRRGLMERRATLAADGDDAHALVGCGRPAAHHELIIVDPQTRRPLREGAVGEIWARGPSIAEGYWGLPELTQSTFKARMVDDARTFLRTGDLGFIVDGELYINGRVKDVIIVRGQNYYPQDIELAGWLSHEALEPGAAAAFGLSDGQAERVVLVQEIRASHLKSAGLEEIVASMRRAIAIEFDLKVEVVLIRPRTLGKTSSGKVQRSLAKQQYLARELAVVHQDGQPGSREPGQPSRELPALHAELIALYRTVLKVESVSLASDFFDMSGDSLDAARLIGQIEDAFGVAVPLETFYRLSTVGEVADYLAQRREQLRAEGARRAIPFYPSDKAPLSFAQRRLWFLSQVEGQNRVLNLPAVLALRGELDVSRLADAFTRIQDRHAILRTTYFWEDGAVWQRVNPPQPVSIELVDLRQEPDPTAQARTLAREDAAVQFDLRQGPIFRVRVLRLAEREYRLLFTIHHIAADAWSMDVLINELSQLYADPAAVLTAPAVRYADYAAWQGDTSAERIAELSGHWRAQLAGAPALLPLPYDRARPRRQSFVGAVHCERLPHALIERLRQLGRKYRTTLFVTMLSAFQLELSRLSGLEDIVVGTDIANRSDPRLAGVIGFFVNQLVLRGDLRRPVTFEELLCDNRERVARATEHQDMPFDRLVDELAGDRDPRYSPLFQVKFLLNHSPIGGLRLPGLTIEPVQQEVTHSQYDLTLSIDEHGGEFTANFHYNTDLFTAGTIADFMEDYLLILQCVSDDVAVRLAQIPCYQTRAHAYERASHGARRANQGSFKSRFEAQAARRADATALICEEESLSYGALNGEVNRLAHFLADLGLQRNSIVGVHMGRSINQVVTLMALVKLGVAFLPLDQDYPTERIEHMLDDSMPDLVITDDAQHPHLAEYAGGVFELDARRQVIAQQSTENLDGPDGADERAYLLYTSGSSGRPKGVQIGGAALWNLCCWYENFAEVSEASTVIHAIPLSFDASIKNILTPLIAGGRLVLPAGTRFDAAVFNDAIEKHRVTVINCVPSLFYAMLEQASKNGFRSLHSLDLVALGGEPTDIGALRPWLASPHCQASVANIYGPTECADISVAIRLTGAQLMSLPGLPIGRPIDNIYVYVVNPDMTLSPPGVAGELLIGGAGVGMGYLGHAGAEASKFIDDPFGRPGKLYRTGDIVKWDRQGLLHYQGRADKQIKVNGIRIETGEIEAALTDLPGIRQATVMLVGKRLLAYIVTSSLTPPTAGQLREQLRKRLPAAWVPKAFVPLRQMPLLPNGKIDQNALAQIAVPPDMEDRQIVAPTTEVQRRLVDIFGKVLEVGRIGITDNFFELGGDSMAAVKVVAMADEVQISLSVTDVFELQTVELLAEGRDLQQPRDPARAGAGAHPEQAAFDMLSAEDLSSLLDAR